VKTEPAGPRPAGGGSPLRGILLMVLAGLFSMLMNSAIRHISAELHPFEIAFFRNIFGFVMLIPLLVRAGGFVAMRTRRLGLHAARGAFNAVGMLAFFLALSMAPLADVAALNFTSPLFAALMAVLFLGERLGPRRKVGLVLGFVGALIILRPGIEVVSQGAMIALLAAAGWACAMVIIKMLTRTETSLAITAYAALFVAAFSLPPALFVWQWPSLAVLAWLLLIGLLGSAAQLSLAQAFAETDATVILPFDFFKLVWASIFGYVFFAEVTDPFTWLGGTVIFASATYIAIRERQAARQRAKVAEEPAGTAAEPEATVAAPPSLPSKVRTRGPGEPG
jgi:drug/metabolite transporter (DMT)-like permease